MWNVYDGTSALPEKTFKSTAVFRFDAPDVDLDGGPKLQLLTGCGFFFALTFFLLSFLKQYIKKELLNKWNQ